MLDALHIENFKTWQAVNLQFGQITGLFGTNSSGKSSLIQFLLLLKQTKEATDRSVAVQLKGQYVDLGNYSDAVYAHDEKREISWKFCFKADEAISIIDPSKSRKPIVRSTALATEGLVASTSIGPAARRIAYSIGDSHMFSLSAKRSESNAFELKAAGDGFRFIRTPGRAWQIPGPIKGYAFPDQARTYFQNASFLSDLETAYERQIDSIFYLGPLREYPKREYAWTRSRPLDVGLRGEKTIDAILSATTSGETRNLKWKGRLKSFQEMIAYWLKEMGLIDHFSVNELAKGSNYWQAHVTVRNGGPKALMTDVGFGISQVLPIITLLYFVPEGSTVILEQPEIHLHPLAQANLADLIINVTKARRLQVVFESHSEHLLLRLQRRVAEEQISNEDLKLYFCENAKGNSSISSLKINELGQITNWPDNFMGDAFGETLAAERARLKRMKSA